MIQLVKVFRNAPLKVQGLLAFMGLAAYFTSSYFLETSYVRSKFPVPYYVQQTSFDALQMKEWYAFMLNEDTFGIYLTTQFIDFIFIAAVIFAGFTMLTFVSNLHSKGSFFQKWGYTLAFALPLAGGFDILENLVSFFMIANPADFPDALIIPYSTFAMLKFGSWAIGVLWLWIALIALLFRYVKSTYPFAISFNAATK